jgi:hypothetical protein
MMEGASGSTSPGSGWLKNRYRGLAVGMRFFVVSYHQKGRLQRLRNNPKPGTV